MNACRHCGHTWHPRGRKKSARCPNPECGRTDGVELAVVQGESEHEATVNEAHRGGVLYAIGAIVLAVALLGLYFLPDNGKPAHAEPPPRAQRR
jgi:hypothetical protein